MSNGVGKVTVSLAQAPVIGPGVPTVLVEGVPISVEFDRVTPHGDPPHASPVFPPGTGNPTVLAQGLPILRENRSVATCGHVMTNGAPTVITN